MNLNILSVLKKLRYTHKLSLFNPFLSINIKSFHSTTIVSLNQIITDEKVKFQLEGEKNNNLLKEIEVKKERKSSSRLNKRITKREEKNSIRLLRLRKKLVRS
jgi:hypothetical protein